MEGATRLLEYSSECPFRPPDWRWRHAEVLRVERIPYFLRRADRWIVRALRFLDARAQATTEAAHAALAQRDPAVARAHQLWIRGEHPVRWHLEARLLTGEPRATISARCHLDEATVEAYEALFFNVTDRLASPDFIVATTIGPSLFRGLHPRDVGSLWKLHAYRGGPLVLDYLVALGNLEEKPERPDQVESFLAAAARGALVVKVMFAALTIPLDVKTSLRLLKLSRELTGTGRKAKGRGRPPEPVDFTPNIRAMVANLEEMRRPRPPWPTADPVPLPSAADPAAAPNEVTREGASSSDPRQ